MHRLEHIHGLHLLFRFWRGKKCTEWKNVIVSTVQSNFNLWMYCSQQNDQISSKINFAHGKLNCPNKQRVIWSGVQNNTQGKWFILYIIFIQGASNSGVTVCCESFSVILQNRFKKLMRGQFRENVSIQLW